MNEILIPVLIVAVIGVLAGLILSLASKFMSVPVDERFNIVRECLPGANCGACGFAGCDAYANAIINDGVATNLCPPGGAECAKNLSNAMGVEFVEATPTFAVVKCKATSENTSKATEYTGTKTCKACFTQFGGDETCSYACMGYGDCKTVCDYGAVEIIDGVAVINRDLCVSCGLCVKACPKNIIEIIPMKSNVVVTCSSCDKGGVARKACKVACIGCKKCEKACKFEAITIENNLAKIDYTKCVNCRLCVKECPTQAIVTFEKRKAK